MSIPSVSELTEVRDLLKEIGELMDSLSEIQLPVSVKSFRKLDQTKE